MAIEKQSPYYMNGFNECAEIILNIITDEIQREKSGDESVNDSLRLLRMAILKKTFNTAERV